MDTNEREQAITALLVTLGAAIETKDWSSALDLWERLLTAHAPLAAMHPHVAVVLRNHAALVYPRSESIH